ncbi:MAG: NAD(P)-dependent oxidoreductase [Bacteroidales bacterium]|nr:NAD(P)-dependent oxidoreductase [Bacteroidales bacterium]
MKHKVENVFIAGGTGFLGYYSALLFLEKGASVATIALDEGINEDDWFPKEITKTYGDLFAMSEDQIFLLLNGKNYDTFVYGLGPDERITPKAPAYNFFHEKLVIQCLKICSAAKRAGIKRCIIMNSYFSYFDRINNGKLSAIHPYIKARIEQAEAIITIGKQGVFDVMIMELPYIFGEMHGRMPIWKDVFVERFRKLPAIYFPDGGTTAIHVTGVAEYIVAAAYNGVNGERYPVAHVNIKYRDMISFMMTKAGFPKKFKKLPSFIGYLTGLFIMRKGKRQGLQSGLNLAKIMTGILAEDFFINPTEVRQKLKFDELGFSGGEDVWQGMREAMHKAYPNNKPE